ncbi:helix-turn-helix transcriptional regulator [Fictibacillus nanhaiensis]|uniref:helix-turn-helix domain-containing protein n=1 Tax=Fictibacillus nanhaiensis TaxID=742169 RepID=UPI002E22C423|nr:helix-turn-helix transcriptional regulator [Fictibacillus nanhaiensis]
MIGRNIHELRVKKGITLSELAKRAKISKSYLSNIERKLNKNPSIHVIEKIAAVLEVDVQLLIGHMQDNQPLEQEWLDFIEELKSLGVKKERVHEYRELIEYINWKKQQEHAKRG